MIFILTYYLCIYYRPASISYRGRTSVGVKTTGCPLPPRIVELSCLLQYQVLHVKDFRGPSTAIIYTYYETLEEDKYSWTWLRDWSKLWP